MSEAFLKSHYFLLFTVIWSAGQGILNKTLGTPDYIWLLSFFPENFYPFELGVGLFICAIFCTVLNLVVSNSWLRFITFLFFILLLSYKYSFGKINHGYHIWIISSFALIFFESKSPLLEKKNVLMIRIVQSWLLMQYFVAGVWKIISNKSLFTTNGITQTALEHIAYGIAQVNLPLNSIRSLLVYESSLLAATGFVLVLSFQLFCGFAGFFARAYMACGIMAVLFHLVTGFALGIWFSGTAIAALFFLVYYESLVKPLTR